MSSLVPKSNGERPGFPRGLRRSERAPRREQANFRSVISESGYEGAAVGRRGRENIIRGKCFSRRRSRRAW